MAFYMPYNHVTLRHFSIFHRRITTSAAGKNGMLFGRVWAGLRTRSPATTKAAALPGWILPLSRDRVPAAWRFLQHVPSVEDEKALATRSQDSGAHQESTTGELKDHVRETHTDKTVGVKGEAVGEGEDSMKNGNKKNKKSILESIYKAKEKNSTLTAKRRETRSERKTKMKEKNKAEETKRETPLDQFFTSFEGFTYDAHLSPEASFKSLRRYKGWKSTKDDGPGKDALSRYQKALVEEVKMWFGNEKDLTAWWTLCKAVGRYDPPGNIRECAAILRNTHVNIVDLIAWRRKGGDEEAAGDKVSSIVVFKSVKELKDYTKRTQKVFPMREIKHYNGGNVVLRHLLRRIFS